MTFASLFTLGLSSWYLYPNLVGLFGQANQAISTFQYYEGTRFFSLYSDIPSVLRLISSPEIYSSTSPYGNYFLTNSYVIFGGFLVVYLFVTGLLVSNDQKWRFFRFYFGLVFLVALFMAGGISTPGVGYVFGWLYIHVPGFWVFQNGYNWLFVIALAYAISLTALLDTMSNRIGRRMRFVLRPIAMILMILVILSSSLPLYQGRIFESADVFPQIPIYWQNAAQWINSQPGDFKIFLLPGGGPFPTYSWGHPRDAVTSAIVSKPTIYWSAEISPSIASLYTAIYNTVQLRSPNTFPEALSAIGARYVIVQGDVDNYKDINSINNWLRNLPGLLDMGTFGPLEIYENMLYNGRIFVAGNQHLLFSGTSLVALRSPSGRVHFSSNTASFRNSLPNETDTKSWSLVTGNSSISTGTGPFANTQSISISGVADTGGFLALKYNSPVSLGGTKHLEIWLKSASFISSNGFQLRFLDSGSRLEIFDFPFDIPADSWVQWVIDVQSPDHVDTGFQASESLDLVPFFAVALGRAISFEFGGIDLDPILGPSNAILSYYESSPTSYTVHANATGAYVLVFSDSYSPQWTAYIGDEQVTNHFEINNYSNAWLINKTGSYDITVNFTVVNGTSFIYYPSNAILSYYESSPTSYTVHANATGAYVLVFSDSYSPQWTAYIADEQVTNHFEINNYSNAWLINKTGSYDITVNFTGQQSYFYGEVLTGFTFVLMLLCLLSTEPASVHFLRRVAEIIKAKSRREGPPT